VLKEMDVKYLLCCLLSLMLPIVAMGQAEEAGADGYHRLMVKGKARLEVGECVSAIELFEKALKLEPNDVEAKFSLASAMMGQHRYEEAIRLLQPIMVKHPANPTIKNNLAWCYLKSRDTKVKNVQRALDLSREAVFMVQNNYNLWHTLASIHYELKDYKRAKRLVSIALYTGGATTGALPRECLQLLDDCRAALGETDDQSSAAEGGGKEVTGDKTE
jgi:tetratricopeptide (TPR) repeat protein